MPGKEVLTKPPVPAGKCSNGMRMDSAEPIGIVGSGRLAQALGRLLAEAGQPLAVLSGRDPEHAAAAAAFVGAPVVPLEELPGRAARVLVAVSDDAIRCVAERLAAAGMRHGVALHTSGVYGPEALAPLAAAGVCCGAIHPLQTIATPKQGLSALKGAAFGITAQGAAAAWARQIVSLAGGLAIEIPAGRRPLYHAAAVMASNCLVGLVDAAVMLLKEAGVAESQALGALAPLLEASCRNTLALGPRNALTGPIQRGDHQTVALHWKALAEVPCEVRELYRACARQLICLARRRGLEEASAERLEQLFS